MEASESQHSETVQSQESEANGEVKENPLSHSRYFRLSLNLRQTTILFVHLQNNRTSSIYLTPLPTQEKRQHFFPNTQKVGHLGPRNTFF